MDKPCSIRGCTRPAIALNEGLPLCEPHNHQRLRGRPYAAIGRPRGANSDRLVKLPGLRVTKQAAAKLKGYAERNGTSTYGAATTVLEGWAQRQH